MYINKVVASLQSKDAKYLFEGGAKTKRFVPSFIYVLKRVNKLHNLAMVDNPYADTALIQIDSLLDDTFGYLNECTEYVEGHLSDALKDGLKVSTIKNTNPHKVEVTHLSEYSSEIFNTILLADKVYLKIRTTYLLKLIEYKDAHDMIKSITRMIRRIYDNVIGFEKRIDANVKRKDILESTAIGLAMIEKLGKPNSDIMNKTITYKNQRIPDL